MAATPIAAKLEQSHAGSVPAQASSWRLAAMAERAAALLLLLAVAPVLLIAAVITAILSRDSPFVAHARVGHGGRPIRVIKLRTMWGATPRSGRVFIEYLDSTPVPAVKTPNDPRVSSSFACFCRRYSIDELPQFWHALMGEMALVGPRPITAAELRQHYGASAAEVLSVLPGITGLWQVAGRNGLTYRQRRLLDLFLVRKRSAGLYLFVLATTARAVLSGRNSG
jgi:lipopolysaccharide/colanic/teichoic acid biosynthesis glycosyltransferase